MPIFRNLCLQLKRIFKVCLAGLLNGNSQLFRAYDKALRQKRIAIEVVTQCCFSSCISIEKNHAAAPKIGEETDVPPSNRLNKVVHTPVIF